MSSLRDIESILKTLATSIGDTEAFLAFKSESDSEHNVHSNYRSSHDTPDKSKEDGIAHTPTPESETTILTLPAQEENPEQQPEKENNRIPTPPLN